MTTNAARAQQGTGARAEQARITVNLPLKVWDALQRIANEAAITRTEALRRAISTEVFRREIEDKGGRFVIEWPDGTHERVNFPY